MSDKSPELIIKRRNLPHWTLEGAIYFVTFRLRVGVLSWPEQWIAFNHIIQGDGRFHILIAAVVMPDHVHLIFKPLKAFSLSRIMKGIKGVSARLVNKSRNSRGPLWQDESYDRIMRNVDELYQKIGYMYYNPVRAELVENPDEYPFWYFDEDWVDKNHI